MFIKLVQSNTSKHTQVYLVESYRDNGKIKHRTIKRYGVLQELQKDDPNVLSKLRAEALELTQEKEDNILSLIVDLNKSNDFSTVPLNIGSVYISKLINTLGLSPLIESLTQKDKFHYDLHDALSFLVMMRILSPGSKRAAHASKETLYRTYDLTLDDLYRSLDHFDTHKDAFIKHLDDHMIKHYQRDKTLVYYDVTNYYFESNQTSDLREVGPSKENSKHPIVSMGLFIDTNNYPITYDMFKGNTHDSKTLIPLLSKMKDELGFDRCIVVADKGINGGNNIKHILDHNHGYIFASKVRGASDKIIKIALDEKDYVAIGKDFKYKKVEFNRKVNHKDEIGKTKSFTVTENTVIFYSRNYDEKAKHERDKVLEKLSAYIDNPKQLKQKTKQGKFKYLKQVESNPETGEVINPSLALSIDDDKVQADSVLDGYYLIASSELDLTASEIIEKYRGLWQIEKSFRIIKSELEGRPIHVSTDEHIKGHFFICFMALLVSRILEKKLGGVYSIEAIQEGLKGMQVMEIEQDIFKIAKYSKVQKAIQDLMGGVIDKTYMKKEKLNKLLKEK